MQRSGYSMTDGRNDMIDKAENHVTMVVLTYMGQEPTKMRRLKSLL